ncbi:MAG: glycyl-radical enzyme activating protein [Chloroflexota bacterium]
MSTSPTGILFDLRRFSIHDGPGIRTAVFFKGCPLRCTWCHNPESQSPRPELILRPRRCIACLACIEACPIGAVTLQDGAPVTDLSLCQACGECAQVCYAESRQVVGQRYTVQQVMDEMQRDGDFYAQSGGGVTFSGGEPLQQWRFLLALLQAAKAGGLHTCLDTCGYAPWERLERVLPYVDLFLYDLKLIDSARHRQYTGVPNRRILSNLRQLAASGASIRLRLPVIPGVNDDEGNLHATARFAAGLPNLQGLDLLAYHNSAEAKYRGLGRPYPPGELASPGEERMQAIAALFEAYGLPVRTGG